MTETEPDRVTDKTLSAWLKNGAVNRSIGGGLTFSASAAGAAKGHASVSDKPVAFKQSQGPHMESGITSIPQAF